MCVTGKVCDTPPVQTHGHHACMSPYWYRDTCEYECDSGYMLRTPHVHTILCDVRYGTNTVRWDKSPSNCIGTCLTTNIHTACSTNITIVVIKKQFLIDYVKKLDAR